MAKELEKQMVCSLVCFATFAVVTFPFGIGTRTITNETVANVTSDDTVKCGECTNILLYMNVMLY